MITVAATNHSTSLTSAQVDDICRALSIQASYHMKPVWDTDSVSVQQRQRYSTDWELHFYETSDQAGALGYHDVEEHKPILKVFVSDCKKYGYSVSAVASHELGEALCDPDIIRITSTGNGKAWALEIGDPAQAFLYPITVKHKDGTSVDIQVQDFVTPAWFGADSIWKPSYKGNIKAPFEVPSGGYAQYTTDLSNWHQVGAELGAGHQRPELRRG